MAVPEHVSIEEMQAELKNLNQNIDSMEGQELIKLSKAMDEAARCTFARLVLFSGFCLEKREAQTDAEHRGLSIKDAGKLARKDLLEYCSLTQSALSLDCVQRHLRDGRSLFPQSDSSSESPTASSPPQRLKRVQSLLFRAMGYDADSGHRQFQQLFFSISGGSDTNATEWGSDEQVLASVAQMLSAVQEAIARASAAPSTLSDQNHGGVTRVVAVHHAEVDAETGEVIASYHAAPTREYIPVDQSRRAEHQQRQNQMQVAAASLQNEILDDLKNMTEEERNSKLLEARHATEEFLQTAATKPMGPARIEYLQSIDEETQRLMIMNKLWDAAVTETAGE